MSLYTMDGVLGESLKILKEVKPPVGLDRECRMALEPMKGNPA